MPFPLFVLVSVIVASATVGGAWFASSRWGWSASAAIGLSGAVALILIHGPAYYNFYADDAFITLRYSRHLADGLGPNWNTEGHVEGYTNFLWMAVIAGLGRLGFDMVDATRALGFISIVATFLLVGGIWKLWRDDAEDEPLRSPLLPVVVLVGLALSDGVVYWGFSGLETAGFMALVTATAYLYFLERRRSSLAPWSAVAAAACGMMRPEGVVVAAVTGAFVLYDAVVEHDRPTGLRRVAAWGAVFPLLYGSFFFWRYTYYGYLFPNTFYAKVGMTTAAFDRGLQYVVAAGMDYYLLAMALGLVVLLLSPLLRRDAAYILVLSAVMMLVIVLEGGEDFPRNRFVVPYLPLLFLGGLGGLGVLVHRAALSARYTASIIVGGLALAGLSLLPASIQVLADVERQALRDRQTLGTWLNENTPEDWTIAAFAVGSLAYHADDRGSLDMLGLTDERIAHTDVDDFGKGVAGHEKYNVDYVLEEVRPEVIVIADAEPVPLTEEELHDQSLGVSLVRGRDALLNDPRLWERYVVAPLNLEGFWFNILVRADVVGQLPPVVRQE